MKFTSTRNENVENTLSHAILEGIAPDNGLYIPKQFPSFNPSEFEDLTLVETAVQFLSPFFTGDPLDEYLQDICENTFQFPISLEFPEDDKAILELFHGPTGSFKDVGARFLAQCFRFMNNPTSILVATSGDTGSAVASAFYGIDDVPVFVLYPKGKVSKFQEQQITYWNENIFALRVNGDFDDCQDMVKQAFDKLSKEYNLSSANSINIGRLLPQCVYYVASSIWYKQKTGKNPSFIIPTGNMGNSLAAIWTKLMGFPIDSIYIACNENDTIPQYFQSGEFISKKSIKTLANAMDVGNPSNMERFLNLTKNNPRIKNQIRAISVSDYNIKQAVKWAYKHWKRNVCPHTATAVYFLNKDAINNPIVVATAHPYKFNNILDDILEVKLTTPENLQKFVTNNPVVIDINSELEDLEDILYKYSI